MKFTYLESLQSLAIVGATGLVGREFIDILDEHKIRVPNVRLFGSGRSKGEFVLVCGQEVEVEELTDNALKGVEAAFFSVPTDISRKYIPNIIRNGTWVIDDSSAFRMIPDVPLVVPEINEGELENYGGNLVANPNCSTIPVAQVLEPLHKLYGIDRVVVSTYQSVSGAGTKAFEELSAQTVSRLNGASVDPEVFPHPIAFNCLPQIGAALENGSCDEEEKIVNELRKILDIPDLRVSATTVRVPTFCGHGASVNVSFQNPIDSIEEIQKVLDATPGLKVIDQPQQNIYPTNQECVGSDETFVGRIRRDGSLPSALNFWTMSDNLRKGAALNSLQILESWLKYKKRN